MSVECPDSGPGCAKTRAIVVLIACVMVRARIWRIGAVDRSRENVEATVRQAA